MQDIELFSRSHEGDCKKTVTPRGGWCIGNGQVAQLELHDKCLCLNCMHDPMAVMVEKNDKRNSNI